MNPVSFPFTSIQLQSMLHYQSLPLDSIVTPSCIFHTLYTESPPADFQKSVEQFGITLPPLVQEGKDGLYNLVFGMEEIMTAQKLGFEILPCAVISPTISPLQYYQLLNHILKERGTTAAMEALLIEDAARHLDSEQVNHLLQCMGYSTGKGTLKKFAALSASGKEILSALHRGVLPVNAAIQLSSLSRQDSAMLIGYIEQYAVSGSKQKQLIRKMIDLIKRENSSIEAICMDWEESAQTTDPENIPQRAKLFLEYVEKRHSPHLCEAEEKFEAFAHTLQLPQGMQVHPSQSFESDNCSLVVQFPSKEKLLRKLEQAKNLLQ